MGSVSQWVVDVFSDLDTAEKVLSIVVSVVFILGALWVASVRVRLWASATFSKCRKRWRDWRAKRRFAREETGRIQALEAAMTLGETGGVEHPLLVSGPDGVPKVYAPKGRAPFVFLKGSNPPSVSKARSAYVDLWQYAQKLNRLEVGIAVPAIEPHEEEAARQLRRYAGAPTQPDRAGCLEIVGDNAPVIRCAIFNNGAAFAVEWVVVPGTTDGGKWEPNGVASPGAFQAGGWHTVAVQRTDTGCTVVFGEDDQSQFQYESKIEWPAQVNVRLVVQSNMVVPIAWFTRPRVS